jgi:hypothetical protein
VTPRFFSWQDEVFRLDGDLAASLHVYAGGRWERTDISGIDLLGLGGRELTVDPSD